MQFSQIIGQDTTKEQLVHMVSSNRLSHALLFLGKEGNGALSLARALAQYIVCENTGGKERVKQKAAAEPAMQSLFGEAEPLPPTPATPQETFPADACGICPACKKAAEMIHPDIHFTYPVIPQKSGDKPKSIDFIRQWREFQTKSPYGNAYDWLQFIGAENKQGNIYTHEIPEIIHQMNLKSFESEYKILIIWQPEALGNEANKLLKLIEEPPPNSLFILVSENESQILPTILSRTQLVKIPALSEQEIANALQQQQGLSAEQARQISILAQGNYLEALQQIQNSDADWDVLLRDWMNTIIRTGPQAQLKWIEDFCKNGREKQKQFLKYFIQMLEFCVRQRYTSVDESTSKNYAFSVKFNRITSPEQQALILQELEQAIYYIERNANSKMLFHALTIKLYHIITNKSVILMY